MKQLLHSRRLWEVCGSLALVLVVSAPFFSSAKSHHTIYVDDNASGTQDGSSKHPYKTIARGLDHAGENDVVNVASGAYEENITLPKGVTLTGAGRDKTYIVADSSRDSVVFMKDNTKLQGVTVRKGKVGVVVKEKSNVAITDSTIRDNKQEGVVALKGATNDRGKLSIIDCNIYDNGRSGVYTEKREIVILDSTIRDNGRNGVAFEAGSKIWIKNTTIRENKENGVFMRLDGSSLTLASGTNIRDNSRNGVAVESNGGSGWVSIKRTKIVGNHHYAVARVAKGSVNESVWKSISLENPENVFGNKLGNISPILK
jgi:hypothetical protein